MGRKTTFNDDKVTEDASHNTHQNEQMPFFGLLNSEQQEYFKQAESTLNLDTFDSAEEKAGFVQGVLDEAKGSELKLATNQICSKLMERLILLSTETEMRQLYAGIKGFFYQLCIHKYASHVLETFIVRVASMVEKELLRKDENEEDNEEVTMEEIVLEIMNEVKPSLRKLTKNKYGSHVLRLLLYVLAGKELPSSVESNSLLRSKKSKIARKMVELTDNEDYKRSFQVPSSFGDALAEFLSEMLKEETTQSLRESAIDPVESPVIQLLIQLEGKVGRDRRFWCMTFGRADDPKNDKESAFVEYLLSDSVGSHFLETALSTQKIKNINRLYRHYMADRIPLLAKRETTGSFVIGSLLEKLRHKEQQEIMDQLVPILNELIVNNTSLGANVVECSQRNDGYLKDEIVNKMFEFYNRSLDDKNVDDSNILENLLQLSHSTLYSTKDDWPTSEERRKAIFLEKLIAYDDRFLKACVEALIGLADEKKPVKVNRVGRERAAEEAETEEEPVLESEGNMLVEICKHGVFSHIVESCVSQPDRLDMATRKRLLNALVGHVVELACNSQGSHVIDKLWDFTFKLNMFKERIARKLLDNQETIKKTVYGRQVWRNWQMDKYSWHFGDWKRMLKQDEMERAAKEVADKKERGNGRSHDHGRRQQHNDRKRKNGGRYESSRKRR